MCLCVLAAPHLTATVLKMSRHVMRQLAHAAPLCPCGAPNVCRATPNARFAGGCECGCYPVCLPFASHQAGSVSGQASFEATSLSVDTKCLFLAAAGASIAAAAAAAPFLLFPAHVAFRQPSESSQSTTAGTTPTMTSTKVGTHCFVIDTVSRNNFII